MDLAGQGVRGDQEDLEDRRDQPSRLSALGHPGAPGDREDLAGREVQADQQLDDPENQGDPGDPVDQEVQEVLMAQEDPQQKHQELQVRKEKVKSKDVKGIHWQQIRSLLFLSFRSSIAETRQNREAGSKLTNPFLFIVGRHATNQTVAKNDHTPDV